MTGREAIGGQLRQQQSMAYTDGIGIERIDRCRYKGDSGMRRWVGLGVIGDNLLTLGNALAKTPDR